MTIVIFSMFLLEGVVFFIPKKYRYNVLKVVMICNDERNVSLQSFVHSQRPGVPGFEDRKM